MVNTKNKKYAIFVLIVSCMAIIGSAIILPDKTLGRNFFYAVIFLVVITAFPYVMSSIKQKNGILLVLAILFVGLSQCIWVARFHGSADSIFMADKNYPRTYVYLFLGALLILCSRPLRIEGRGCLIIMIFSIVGFIYLSGRGLYYSFTDPSGRLRIDSAATASAYLFVLQSFFTLYLVRETRHRWWAFVSFLVVVITVLVVLLTETRSVLIIYPCLLVSYLLLNNIFPVRTVIKTSLMTLGVVLTVVFMFFHGVQDRMVQAWYEVSHYQQNNDTSIGARVSMWGAGLYALEKHPFGQSAETRYREVSNYINAYEKGNPEGLRNAVYHLHNDFIESMSLQGVMGGVALMLLFISLCITAYKKNLLREMLPFFILPIILFGMIDTLFINDRFVVMFCLQLFLYISLCFPQKNNVIE